MHNYLAFHRNKLLIIVSFIAAIFIVNVLLGDAKPFDAITWVDIFGEGSVTGLSLCFLLFILASRPIGLTTNLLFWGVCGFAGASFQDLLDELIVLPTNNWFGDIIESIITPFALMVMAAGFYRWHQEQKMINEQLRRKERFSREHSAIDCTTGLYTAMYMEQQLQRELLLIQQHITHTGILLIDIDGFSEFNRMYGDAEGDRLLKQVSDLIIMNIRAKDLACRYAADRFIVLLPESNSVDTQHLVDELNGALTSLAFKPNQRRHSIYHGFSIASLQLEEKQWQSDSGIPLHHNEKAHTSQVLRQLNAQLNHVKHKKRQSSFAAVQAV